MGPFEVHLIRTEIVIIKGDMKSNIIVEELTSKVLFNKEYMDVCYLIGSESSTAIIQPYFPMNFVDKRILSTKLKIGIM